MKVFKNPEYAKWDELTRRPTGGFEEIRDLVRSIVEDVRSRGDQALVDYSIKFDGVTDPVIETSISETAIVAVKRELREAIDQAAANIRAFHKTQIAVEEPVETMSGVVCWRKNLPIKTVGLYIPGGTAPLFSTLLMLAIPAQLAGCGEIVVCTPPNKNGDIDPAIQYVAKVCGIQKIYCVGGAQAIAAMTFGTDTIPKCDKIFGPGNSYVTCAKQVVTEFGVAIDMPAGPSEVLVLADEAANPKFVAADLLAQAEHGTDSQVILVSECPDLINNTIAETNRQLETLPRKSIAAAALSNSRAIIFDKRSESIAFINKYAAEHLIIATQNADQDALEIECAGSVFIGRYSCETAGDYASGTNHTLPTNGFARNYSGVSVDSFVNKVTFQKLSAAGIRALGPTLMTLAKAEGLEAHSNAVAVRLAELEDEEESANV